MHRRVISEDVCPTSGRDKTAKLKFEIDNLNKKLHAELEQMKQRSKTEEKLVKGKVQAIRRKDEEGER